MKKNQVRVYCKQCKGGDNHVWKGTLQKWAVELLNPKPPKWFNYITRHCKAHPGHEFMVEYPSKTVPFASSKKLAELI